MGKSGSVAEKEGVSGVLRVGGKGAWQGVGRACGDCLPGQPGEVVMGRRQGQGLLVEQLQGSVQKKGDRGRDRLRSALTSTFPRHCNPRHPSPNPQPSHSKAPFSAYSSPVEAGRHCHHSPFSAPRFTRPPVHPLLPTLCRHMLPPYSTFRSPLCTPHPADQGKPCRVHRWAAAEEAAAGNTGRSTTSC